MLDGTGRLLGETDKSDVDEAGYFTLYMEALGEGSYIDNVIFTHVSEEKKTAEPQTETRRIDYSTWTATDALGRTTADNGTAGDPNENRYVGLFYFLCWVGAGQHVQDNTKLYLDGGMEVARNFILPFITEGKHAEADYKTRLQEIVQQNPEERLSYVVESESGPDHDKHFVVAVRFNSDRVARGEGRSKKAAEQHAAKEALKLLGVIKEK